MIATIHQPQYLPWLGYFDKIHRADVFFILDTVQFKKNEWQNRNKIRTPQGAQWLTVPVLHQFGQKINEVRINNKQKWREAHWKALNLNYAKAPFFNDYMGVFESIYFQEWEFLVDINIRVIEKLVELLGIKTRVVKASDYQVAEDKTQRLVDLCQWVNVDQYLSGKDGSKYMDFDLFERNDIEVITQEFEHPVYRQLWCRQGQDDFVSHLSVIDLLFNHGQESLNILIHKNNGS